MQLISAMESNEIIGGGKPNTCKSFVHADRSTKLCEVEFVCYNKHGNIKSVETEPRHPAFCNF